MARPKTRHGVYRKITFDLPEDIYKNVALLAASAEGSPLPGPYCRDIITGLAKQKGGIIRAGTASKKKTVAA